MYEDGKLRIGVITIQNAPWKELVRRWKFIDNTEFDSLWVADHFTHWNKKHMAFFECWTTLCGMACETSRIRVGTAVTNMQWRHPAWLAKQALTVDHMSNGRLDLGLGAGGSSDLEHSMTGVDRLSPAKRVECFEEYLEIIDQLLRKPVTTYHGKYFHLEKAIVEPDPIQKPRPPVYIGASGPRMLKITAKFADAWNMLGDIKVLDETLEKLKERNALLDRYCKEIGRNPAELRRTFGIYESKAMHTIGKMIIYENLDTLRDVISKLFGAGVTEMFIPYPFDDEDVPKFEFFAEEMLPELKKRYS